MASRFDLLIGGLFAILIAGFAISHFHAAPITTEQAAPAARDTSPIMTSRAQPASRRTVNILFIGNSYTFVNDMPGKLIAIADADADSPFQLNVQMVARGGATLTQEYNDSPARTALQSRKWNIVVLQEQSFWAMMPESVGATNAAVRAFDALVRQDGGRTVLFLSWARAPGSHWYRDVQTGFLRDPDYMQQQFDAQTNALGAAIGAPVVPAGDYWAAALQMRPQLKLYLPDGTHPSPTGAFLNALAFYHHLLGRPVDGNAYLPAGVNAEDATFLRQMVSATKVGG